MQISSIVKLSASLSALALCTVAQSASLIVNGSFETNTAVTTVFNPSNGQFNSFMNGVTAYGAREGIDIQTFGSGFGQTPQNGSWKISPASDANGAAEEFSMTLIGQMVVGASYDLSFYVERLANGQFNGGSVQIGVSTSATSFGTQVAAATAPNGGWLLSTTTFFAPLPASYLTVRVTNTQSSWVGLDNFTLTGPVAAVPEPATTALLLAGLAVIGFASARRRH